MKLTKKLTNMMQNYYNLYKSYNRIISVMNCTPSEKLDYMCQKVFDDIVNYLKTKYSDKSIDRIIDIFCDTRVNDFRVIIYELEDLNLRKS